MGLRDLLTGRTAALAEFAEDTRPVATHGEAPNDPLTRTVREATIVTRDIALSIPAVRKARHVIVGTISTLALSAWAGGTRLEPEDPRTSWLRQPDPLKTLQTTIAGTVDDGLWQDRAVWRILDRNVSGAPVKFRRIQPSRISVVSDQWDEDLVDTWTIDGREVPARNVVAINFSGLGGLKRWGVDLLQLYIDLQVAAGKYAKAPHPKAILHNHGADLNNPEIIALLDAWEAARESRSTGYLNDVMDYETFGWNAQELQLVEAREYAALEVARIFGLPAAALDAKSGDSMTYGNVVEKRKDILASLRPWMTSIEQTLSLDDRSSRPTGLVVPRGITVRFDADAYTRDDPSTRMDTWAVAKSSGVLSMDEIRANEPLATSNTPPPAAPAPPAVPAPAAPQPQEIGAPA